MALMILIAQTSCVAFLALWLTTGVRDNIRFPQINEVFTAEVMDMTRMRLAYPDAYALVAHRRVQSRAVQRLAFRLVVLWEVLALLALWVATGALALAALGMAGPEGARALGLAAVLMFTATWALFLIVGNHFSYWLCHEGAQTTHYHMTLWGVSTMVFLVIG